MGKAKKTEHSTGKYLQRRKAINSMSVDQFMEETFSREFNAEAEKEYQETKARAHRKKD
jgi:hypothetical protein